MLGAYIHWPFCLMKCPYCDFNSYVAKQTVNHEDYLAAYLTAIDWHADQFDTQPLSSLFFGGGTPSLMQPFVVERVINHLEQRIGFETGIEITLECNPSSLENKKLGDFKTAGVNRLSMGGQSLNNEVLKTLGRNHTAEEIIEGIEIAQRHYSRLNVDFIYGRMNQTTQDWEVELRRILSLGLTHLSLYQLTIEQNTGFYERWKAGELTLPPDETLVAMYNLTYDLCKEAGLYQYEVSNYSIKGEESVHNKLYWQYGAYMGIGAGAHGRMRKGSQVYAIDNEKRPQLWLNKPIPTAELLDEMAVMQERVLMGMRLNEGFDMNLLGYDSTDLGLLQPLIEHDYIEVEGTKVKTTLKGRLILNAVIEYITERYVKPVG